MSDTNQPAWKQRLEELEQYVENLSKTKAPAWAAEKVIQIFQTHLDVSYAHMAPVYKDLIDAIAAALTVPDGHVRLPSGESPKVLGTLHVLASGEIPTVGIEVYHPLQDFSFHLKVIPLHEEPEQDVDFPIPEDCELVAHYSYWESDTGFSQYETYDVRECYSTREAARAAAESARAGGKA